MLHDGVEDDNSSSAEHAYDYRQIQNLSHSETYTSWIHDRGL
jgi:hypothetical protein